MSVALLESPDNVNTLQDDLESFIWLILYHVLRYMKHNRTDVLKDVIASIFDEIHIKSDQPPWGGWGKSTVLTPLRGPLKLTFAVDGNSPLTLWIDDMLDTLEQWDRLITAHKRCIILAGGSANPSRDEAMKRLPFDDSTALLRNHDNMISTFEAVIYMDTWPKSDPALDAFLPPVKRKRDMDDVTEPGDGVISNFAGNATAGAT